MKFFALATVALVANVNAVELHNQAHAKGLKAPHPVRALAQGKDKENFDWQGAANNLLGNAQEHSKRFAGSLSGSGCASSWTAAWAFSGRNTLRTC